MPLIPADILTLLGAFWWPFCRILAALSAAPVLGDTLIPVRVRVLAAAVLAVTCLPAGLQAVVVDPLSLGGVLLAASQILTGLLFGFAFHLVHGALLLAGFLISSQMGLSMAIMNDPANGNSSDVLSQFVFLLGTLLFFAMDGHLVLVTILSASFRFWPVGAPVDPVSLHAVVSGCAWMFGAAFLLAMPAVFSTFVVQLGFGLLNRVAPTLNLFSLGFPLVTLFGLMTLGAVIRFLPAHYLRMTDQVLQWIHQMLAVAHHG